MPRWLWVLCKFYGNNNKTWKNEPWKNDHDDQVVSGYTVYRITKRKTENRRLTCRKETYQNAAALNSVSIRREPESTPRTFEVSTERALRKSMKRGLGATWYDVATSYVSSDISKRPLRTLYKVTHSGFLRWAHSGFTYQKTSEANHERSTS